MVENRAALLIGICWTWTTLSALALAGRFWCRYRYIGKIWWDDWIMLLSFLFALGITITWTYYAAIGGLVHFYQMTPEQLSEALLVNWVGQTFSVLAAATTKVAIALLIARIQSKNFWRTLVLQVLSGLSVVAGIIVIFVVWFQCTPIQGLWRLELRATCWPSSVLINNTIWVSSVWAVADLMLAIIPAHMIWRLQMPMKTKLALSAMLGCGIFAFVCAVVKINFLKDDGNNPDLTYASLDLYVWHTNEVGVVIVAGCIPTLRPLFMVMFRRPGYEEFVRRTQKGHTISEETHITVELSSRNTTLSHLEKSRGNMRYEDEYDGRDYGYMHPSQARYGRRPSP